MVFFGSRKGRPNDDEGQRDNRFDAARDAYMTGKFKIVTTDTVEGRDVKLVFGLVVARGYIFDNAFYGLISRAMAAGAEGIVGYRENVAFHPEGDRYYSCYGTAVVFAPQRR